MNERVTLISLFDNDNLNKILNLINPIKEQLCKIPFGKNVDDRISNDTLPYHFTISAWDIKNEEFILDNLSNIHFDKFKIYVDHIELINGCENSYVLILGFEANKELKALQKEIYNILPTKNYNPDTFKFHITITVDKDYEKIIKIKEKMEASFVPFELEVNSIGLFEIYPAKLIKTINCN